VVVVITTRTHRKPVDVKRRIAREVLFEPPTFDHEREISAQGYRLIAGIDEVGRGAIAGPVTAAAVILPYPVQTPWLAQVRDSKQLSGAKREFLCTLIQATALAIGVGMTSPQDIDAAGIVEATRLAMRRAVGQLSPSADFLVIDALALPGVVLPQRSIVHGDRISLSIACASIVAKVTRDRHMAALDNRYQDYGFARHKGYPTRQHLFNLQRSGSCPIHRQSFAPVERLRRRDSA